MTELSKEQIRYLDLFDGVTRGLDEASPAETMYSIQRLQYTARAREVEITPEASQMMADTLRSKGYKSVADDDFELPEVFMNVPVIAIANHVEDGTLCPSEEDLETLYFAHVIDGCETPGHGLGSGKINEALYDAHCHLRSGKEPQEVEQGMSL